MRYRPTSIRLASALFAAALPAGGCTSIPDRQAPPGQQAILDQFDVSSPFLAAAGDQVDILIQTAPELNRTVTIKDDGFIDFPFIDSIRAAGRPLADIAADLETSLASEIIEPRADIVLAASPAPAIYVGGLVNNPGRYAFSGGLTALEAIITAGDIAPSQTKVQVTVYRRGADGSLGSYMSTVLAKMIANELAQAPALRRFDIVYVTSVTDDLSPPPTVPLTSLALPADFAAYYQGMTDYR